eukprot:GFUD01023361.1.p1 GENE.GFUD01023361.1~~GFUD01023361.1.p1  ORF type:complete len:466 (-),score=160.28 GFUD01023361.1:108-1505(-)
MTDQVGRVLDSDDDFSRFVPTESVLPKKSKLSKKKNKNKENVKKPHTSTQMETAEPLTSRGGRPARKTADEIKFQHELEEALRMSSEDVSYSSAEIVPVSRKEVVVDKGDTNDSDTHRSDKLNSAVVDVGEILVVSDSQESVEHGLSSAETVALKEGKGDTRDDSDEEDIVMKKRQFKVIDSEDEFETEVASKTLTVPAARPSKVPEPLTAKTNEASKKRKVEESWVVSNPKKKDKAENLKTTLKRTPKPIKKYTGDSSDSENLSDEEVDGSDEESDDDEFVPVKSKKKTPLKKSTVKKTPPAPSPKPLPPVRSNVPKVSPKKPLGSHNPIPSPSIPLPKSKNMFQNKSPIKLSFNSKSPVTAPSKPITTPKAFTPGPTSSISSLLKQFQNQTKSTPIMGVKAQAVPSAPSTPLQNKIPGWTPPARIGTPGSSSSTPGQSPSIGLRVGLSRNFKSKPLHSGVKYP